jgi:FkbM family methyltransferase
MPEPDTRLPGSLGERVATRCYRVVQRTQLLDSPVGRRVFDAGYRFYKRYGNDPYRELVRTRPRLFSGGHILDIGANIGYTASVFAEALTGDGHIFAFEPEPRNFSSLSRLADRSRGRITAIQSAVGDHGGEARLALNDLHPADHRIAASGNPSSEIARRAERRVPMTTVDAFLEARAIAPDEVGFIKIDVQGYEAHVVDGMRRMLRGAHRLALTFEYDPQLLKEVGRSGTALLHDLAELGFSRMYLLEPRTEPVDLTRQALSDLMEARPYCDLLLLPDGH